MLTIKTKGVSKSTISNGSSSTTNNSSKYFWITYLVIGLLVIGIGVIIYFIWKKSKSNTPCNPLCNNNQCGSDDGCGGNCQTGSCTDPSNICIKGIFTPISPTCDSKNPNTPCSNDCQTGYCTDQSNICIKGTCTSTTCDSKNPNTPYSNDCQPGYCTDQSNICTNGTCTSTVGDPICKSLCDKYKGDLGKNCYCASNYTKYTNQCFDTTSSNHVCSAIKTKDECNKIPNFIWCTP